MGKFMKKKGYGARKTRDHNKEYVRRCYKCKSSDHIVADCLYNSDNNEDKKKNHKKEKKEKKEKDKKMTFQKNMKGGGYVVNGIVIALRIVMTLVMMARNLSRRH
jgi:glycerol-3-phosphate dehydrogenase